MFSSHGHTQESRVFELLWSPGEGRCGGGGGGPESVLVSQAADSVSYAAFMFLFPLLEKNGFSSRASHANCAPAVSCCEKLR